MVQMRTLICLLVLIVGLGMLLPVGGCGGGSSGYTQGGDTGGGSGFTGGSDDTGGTTLPPPPF